MNASTAALPRGAHVEDTDLRAISFRHSTTVAGLQEGWAVLERLWAETEDRARALPTQLLYERVRDAITALTP